MEHISIGTNIVLERFKSSSGNAEYEVTLSAMDGIVYCTCPGWRNSKQPVITPGLPKTCKHLLEMEKRGTIDAQHYMAEAGAVATPKPPAAPAVPVPNRTGKFQPMLAHEMSKAKGGEPWGREGWTAELKYDGIRLISIQRDGVNRLFARSGAEHTGRYDFLKGLVLPENTILDGELVPPGIASQWGGGNGRSEPVWVVFDIPEAHGMNMRTEPYRVRRAVVEGVVEALEHPRIQASLILAKDSPSREVMEQVVEAGGEGVMLKETEGLYKDGTRSFTWLKAKATRTVDVVIVDASADCTSGMRKQAGWKNLTYGFYIDGKLTKISSLGVTGPLEELTQHIGKVAEVKVYGVSPKGGLRHPVFLRWRTDKQPADCRLEDVL